MRIKELRLERNLTQSEVAEAISTSQRNIGRWENEENEPSASYVKQLATFFGVSTDYLLGLEDDFGAKQYTATSSSYSAAEQRIIEQYRSLPDKLKKLVKEQLDALTSPNELISNKRS